MFYSSILNKDTSKTYFEVYVIAVYWQNTKFCLNTMILPKNTFSSYSGFI